MNINLASFEASLFWVLKSTYGQQRNQIENSKVNSNYFCFKNFEGWFYSDMLIKC